MYDELKNIPSCSVAMSCSLADTLPDNVPIAEVLLEIFVSCASWELSTYVFVYVVVLSAFSNSFPSTSTLL